MTEPLVLEGVSLAFGGVAALSGVSFTVAPSTIHALIGPNGAGKSSCFNTISGIYHPSAGRIRLGENELQSAAPYVIAESGVGRAFQNIALDGERTVEDNIMVARHRLMRSGFLRTALATPLARSEDRRHRTRVREIAGFLGLTEVLHHPAGALSYGARKKVEMARAIALEPDILLLDEPVAGMPAAEKMDIAARIRAVRDQLGISVLLVEHDMPMVMGLADHVTVLDFGKVIADGPPSAVREDPAVIAAYLGVSDDTEPILDKENV